MNICHRLTRLATAGAALAALTMTVSGPADASTDASTSPPLSATSTSAESAAVNYVDGRMGDDGWDGECQRLVREAYASAGIDITLDASDNTSAVAFWNSTTLAKTGPSDGVPAGALIFWGATASNPYGHVAIALGGDTAASSEERDNAGIHTFSISARNSAGYTMLGWLMPA